MILSKPIFRWFLPVFQELSQSKLIICRALYDVLLTVKRIDVQSLK